MCAPEAINSILPHVEWSEWGIRTYVGVTYAERHKGAAYLVSANVYLSKGRNRRKQVAHPLLCNRTQSQNCVDSYNPVVSFFFGGEWGAPSIVTQK